MDPQQAAVPATHQEREEWEKAAKLFWSRHTCDLYERHAAAVFKLAKVCSSTGFVRLKYCLLDININ